jgi:O-antigen/teichoic acid export membrane protein
MSIGRSLVRNSILVFSTNLATRVSSALLFLVIARLRAPEAAGIFTLAMSYTLLLEAVSQLGLDQLLIRDAARERQRAEVIFQNLLTARLILMTAAIGLFTLALAVGRFYTDDTRLVLVCLALVALPDITVDMCQALFVVVNRLTWPSIISIVTGFVRVGLGLFVLLAQGTLFQLALATLIASAVQMALNVYLVARQGFHFRLSLASLHWRATLTQALPFGVVQILVAMEAYVGSVILSATVTDAHLGYYGAANSLLAAMMLLPNAIQVAIFPRMTEIYALARQNLTEFYTRLYRFLAIVGGGVVVVVLIMAEWVTVLLYRSPFRPSVILLQVLAGTLFVSFLNIPNVRTMIIIGEQGRMAKMLTVSVLFNFLLTMLLIPALDVLAVPIARVASMTCFWGMNQLYVNQRIVKTSVGGLLWRPMLGICVAIGVVTAAREMPIWVHLLAGLFSYSGIVLVTGGLPQSERRYLWSVVFKHQSAEKIQSG